MATSLLVARFPAATATPASAAIASRTAYTGATAIPRMAPPVTTTTTITDDLPADATFVSATPDNATTCSETAGVVTCDLGSLAIGDVVTVVVVADIDLPGAPAVADDIGGLAVRCDVSVLADNHAAASAAVQAFDRLDVVVLNASISSGFTFADFDEAAYRRAMGVNLDGVVFGIASALPVLRARGGGRIVVAVPAQSRPGGEEHDDRSQRRFLRRGRDGAHMRTTKHTVVVSAETGRR